MIPQNRSELPPFDPELYDSNPRVAQPVAVMGQGEFVAIVQWDGNGEDHHWVIVPKGDVEIFIAEVRKVASE